MKKKTTKDISTLKGFKILNIYIPKIRLVFNFLSWLNRTANADDDLEDDEINQYTKNRQAQKESRSQVYNDERSYNNQYSFNNSSRMANIKQNNTSRGYDSTYDKDKRTNQYSRQTQNRARSRTPPSGRSNSNQRTRADEWHDPWERRQDKKDGKTRDYSSSDSDTGSKSRSNSRSRSRSSYSSKSSNSYKSRSSSYSRYKIDIFKFMIKYLKKNFKQNKVVQVLDLLYLKVNVKTRMSQKFLQNKLPIPKL